MLKKLFLSSLLLLALPFSACASEPEPYAAGQQYHLINPPIYMPNDGKIHVTVFFWYGCVHCYNLEPSLQQWAQTQPDDVEVDNSPVMWGRGMDLHAKAYYVTQLLNVEDSVHMALFRAMHVDRNRLLSQQAIAKIFTANGVAEGDFNKAFNDFGVNHQVTQAQARARQARVTGTPQMMVAGKYRISARDAGGVKKMFEVVEYLIEKERKAMAAKKDNEGKTA
ncbi:MAG: disulfide bond formation protein DsbA [Gammaproteobacteria bacterium]|nr:MAG: disulfide bond formation protein DsbA [Gammaproteobacteria bacterium]